MLMLLSVYNSRQSVDLLPEIIAEQNNCKLATILFNIIAQNDNFVGLLFITNANKQSRLQIYK